MTAGMRPADKRANLIAILGVDGSGKSTQAARLRDWLASLGREALVHPNESLKPVKTVLQAAATERGHADDVALLGLDTRQLLLATLKWNTMAKVGPLLAQPDLFVVMDRYYHCQVAAARCLRTGNTWLIERMFRDFPAPDLTLFLDVDVAVATQRITQRGVDGPEPEFLADHAEAYRGLPEARDYTVIPGEGSVGDVAAAVRSAVLQRFPQLAGQP